MRLSKLLQRAYPDYRFNILGDKEYEAPFNLEGCTLQDFSKRPDITDEDLQAAQKAIESEQYADKRRKEYPRIDEQLEAITEYLAATDKDAATIKPLLDKIQAVKAKYPKA